MYEAHGGTHGATNAPLVDPPIAGRKGGTLARARRAVLSDERLAKEAAAGDLGAFEAIFRRYQDDLYRFCVGILREPQDAQDAVQNTMFKAMRALPGERREMQLKPWLYRIAHNEAVELRRRERPAEELVETVDVAAAGTDERAEDNGRLRMLLADIADLPERQRASLVMREVNGLGFGEIGAALGTSPGAVRQALYEARRGLAEMDHGREMQCDLATRMVSDADGRPRDRGVRAHLRDCSPCRRFQAEIRGRGRALAVISPMPAIAAVGALKAALGSGAAGGGVGATAAAGGAGAGVGGAGVAVGSVGAAGLLKPAVSLLAVLAIGTAAVDRGAIFEAGRHAPPTAGSAKTVDIPAAPTEAGRPGTNHAVARHGASHGAVAATGVRADSSAVQAATEPLASVHAAQRRNGADVKVHDEVAASGRESPALDGGVREEPLLPDVQAPSVPAAEDGRPAPVGAIAPIEPEATAEADASPEPGTTAEPGTGAEPEASAESEASAEVPPGQVQRESAQSVPPGQAKKEVEATPEPTTDEPSVPAAVQVEVPAPTAPGQVKKEVESSLETVVPPGQAKKEEAMSE